MTRPLLEFDDLELWLCDWLRPQLAQWAPLVTNRQTRPAPLSVIVRDESGADDLVTARRRVSIRCVGADMTTVGAVARRTAALVRGAALEPGPIAAVGSVYGPYRIAAADQATTTEFYLAVEITVIGRTVQT